jgi:hypothetical protein
MTEVPHKYYTSWGRIALSTAVLLPLGMALVNPTPAAAQSTIIINGGGNYPNRNYHRTNQPQSAPFIYGSPIPSPIPVNPATGLTPRSADRYSNPAYSHPAPIREQNITIINVDRPYDRYPSNRYPEVGYPRIRTVEVIPSAPIPNGLDLQR